MPLRIKSSFYLYRFLSEFVAIDALYALLFKDKGLNESSISSLFLLLSLMVIILEIPTGILADKFDRRILLASSRFMKAGCFIVWLFWPNTLGFGLGFVLWGAGTAFESGCWQALMYDELTAQESSEKFGNILAGTFSSGLFATLISALLGSVLFYFFSDYSWILIISSLSVATAGLLALTFPKAKAREHTTPESFRSLLNKARVLLSQNTHARWLMVMAAIVGGIKGSLDQYHGLLLTDKALSASSIPLIFGGLTLVGALVSLALSHKERTTTAKHLRYLTVSIGLLIFFAAFAPAWIAVALLLVMAGVDNVFRVDNEVLIQSNIESAARATLSSLSSFGTEVIALGVFFISALVTKTFPLSAIYIMGGILLAVAGLWRVPKIFTTATK